jgi:RNA polymerase sigma-70 factor, ECF subfamily
MPPDDALLIELVRGGSQDAAAELFERHWPLVWHWAFGVTGDRGLAEQVAQEAILRAFRSLDRFDPARPFRPWLKRVTVNLAIDELRRERRHESAPEWMSELRAVPPFEDAELLDSVVAAVRTLPPRQRIVVVLHYWLDTGVEEIASLLEIPVGTVVSRLSRARASMRAQLEEQRA